MTAGHTPTPWRVCPAPHGSDIESADGAISIAMAYAKSHDMLPSRYEAPDDEISDANAAFIVRAVNAHEDLVAALKALFDNAERVEHDLYSLEGREGFQPEKALEAARRALAKATQP